MIGIPRVDNLEMDLVLTQSKEHTLANPNDANVVYNNRKPLYYMSTNEGVASHLKQLEVVWSIAQSVQRSLVILPFRADNNHFPGVGSINICHFFDFWEKNGNGRINITCANETGPLVVAEKKCILGNNFLGHNNMTEWPTPDVFFLPDDTVPTTSFDWANISCVAGFFIHISCVLGTHGPPVWSSFSIRISSRYLGILDRLKQFLGLTASGEEFVVVHWRRGDALQSSDMCLKHHTPNCKTTEEFIDHIKTDSANVHHHLVYIATNERNVTELKKLKDAGYHMYSDIQPLVQSLLPEIPASVNNLAVDIMMFCDKLAHPLFYGISLMSHLVSHCKS